MDDIRLRVQAEREMHNQMFIDNRRAPLDKYYDTDPSALNHYLSRLDLMVSGKDILELGCGTQCDSRKVNSVPSSVTMIDISDAAVEYAASLKEEFLTKNVERFVACRMDAHNLDFDDNQFDVVFSRGVLHHLDFNVALSEVARILRPGGTAIFLEPLGHNAFINAYRRLTPNLRTPDERPFKFKDFDCAVRQFAGLDISTFTFFSLLGVLSPSFGSVGRRLDSMVAKNRFLRRYLWLSVLEFKV